MGTTPVKTLLLAAIKGAVQSVTEVKSVFRMPSKPIELDTAAYPAAFIYYETDTKTRRNQIAINSLPLTVEVWLQDERGGEYLSDLGDLVEMKIRQKLLPETGEQDPDVLKYSINFVEKSARHLIFDENRAVRELQFEVTYPHVWGDPTDTGKH